jgi:hypothetical protein
VVEISGLCENLYGVSPGNTLFQTTEAHSNHYDRLSILQLPTIDFVLHHTKPPPHKRKSEPNKKKPHLSKEQSRAILVWTLSLLSCNDSIQTRAIQEKKKITKKKKKKKRRGRASITPGQRRRPQSTTYLLIKAILIAILPAHILWFFAVPVCCVFLIV